MDLKRDGLTISDLLDEVWARHGFHGTEQISIRVTDMSAITRLLAGLRQRPPKEIAGRAVESIDDLAQYLNGLFFGEIFAFFDVSIKITVIAVLKDEVVVVWFHIF